MTFSIRRTTSILLLCLSSALASPAYAQVEVQGFQAWKTAKIDEAKANLEKLQQAKDIPAVAKTMSGKVPGAASLTSAPQKSARLSQGQTSLEVAQELGINDYVVLYLSQFKNNREAFIEAAKKLTPEEGADLIMAYQKHLTSSADLDEPTTVSQTK